jgi:HAD superfamily hydrolase (TIGR01509 family)
MPASLYGVIFDLDGTLVDSRLDFVAMRRETGCPEGTGLLEYLAGLASPEARQRTAAIIDRHEMAGAAAATWMPGARQLLEALCEQEIPVGIVTRNSRSATELTLRTLEAPTMDLVTREDARPKPDPDGLLQLAARWNIVPAELAYIGDFRFDLEAAAAAGMRSALYLQPDNRDYAHLADWSFTHFDELGAWLLD